MHFDADSCSHNGVKVNKKGRRVAKNNWLMVSDVRPEVRDDVHALLVAHLRRRGIEYEDRGSFQVLSNTAI